MLKDLFWIPSGDPCRVIQTRPKTIRRQRCPAVESQTGSDVWRRYYTVPDSFQEENICKLPLTQLQSYFYLTRFKWVVLFLGNFLEVHPRSSAGGSGQLSDVADFDIKKLKILHRKETLLWHIGAGRSPKSSGVHLGTENSSTWSPYSCLWEFQQKCGLMSRLKS